MSNFERANQNAQNSDTIVTAKVVRNTTSSSEKENNSFNYVLVVPVKEIFKFNVEKNLRIYFGEDDAARNRTPVHKEIYNSFLSDPKTFIQKNSGFTVVCDEFHSDNKGEYGISKITLRNASLINGAQSQGELKKLFEEIDLDKDHHDAEVRIEVIVEKNQSLQVDIANSRNSSTNVTNLSKMGGYDYFIDLNKSMTDHNPDWEIAISETDEKVPTQTLLQVIRTLMPRDLRASFKKLEKSEVKSYSGKASVLNEFKQFKDSHEGKSSDTEDYSDVYRYFISIAPYAWEEYLKWNSNPEWISYWKKNQKIGKYDSESESFELSWGIMCPFLHGIQNFVVDNNGEWSINYNSDTFDTKKYMTSVIEMFKNADSNPQTFAKDRSNYLDLWIQLNK